MVADEPDAVWWRCAVYVGAHERPLLARSVSLWRGRPGIHDL